MTGANVIMSGTIPTIVGMGVVSRTTETMFGRRGNSSRRQNRTGRTGRVYRWRVSARVSGKVVTKRFPSHTMEEARRKAKAFFPRHKANNIRLELLG